MYYHFDAGIFFPFISIVLLYPIRYWFVRYIKGIFIFLQFTFYTFYTIKMYYHFNALIFPLYIDYIILYYYIQICTIHKGKISHTVKFFNIYILMFHFIIFVKKYVEWIFFQILKHCHCQFTATKADWVTRCALMPLCTVSVYSTSENLLQVCRAI